MNEKLESALDKVILQNPGPSSHPTSDRMISDLENHFAISDIFKGFGHVPAELGKPDWRDCTKPTTRQALLDGVELLSPEKLEELTKLHDEYQVNLEKQISFSPSAAHKDHAAQHMKIHEAGLDRNASLDLGNHVTLATRKHEYSEKSTALFNRLSAIAKDAFPLCKEAILAAEASLKNTLRLHEESEREIAVAYDMKWEPSQVWKAAAVNLIVARKNIRLFVGRADQGPASLIDGFINLK